MSRKLEFEPSSGNVFADIGIANPEQALAKAEIARQVNRIIQARGLTQAAAAALLGIDQPRVSALSKGRLTFFSLDKMLQFASKLGNEVEISIKPSEHSGITVSTAESANHFVLSTMMVGEENIELSVLLDQQHYNPKPSIKMDSSAMLAIENDTRHELVAA
jgi:predicted XRE-type DNA-binding protein